MKRILLIVFSIWLLSSCKEDKTRDVVDLIGNWELKSAHGDLYDKQGNIVGGTCGKYLGRPYAQFFSNGSFKMFAIDRSQSAKGNYLISREGNKYYLIFKSKDYSDTAEVVKSSDNEFILTFERTFTKKDAFNHAVKEVAVCSWVRN